MPQTREEMTQNLAKRLCWEVARRDDVWVARRPYRKQVVDGVYRLDEGALLDDFFRFLQTLGVMALLEQLHGAAMHRMMAPFIQYVLLYGLKTLSWAKKARQSINSTPVSSQFLSRRQQVLGLPYRRGSSLHGAPVQRIQRIPSKQRRSSTRGRPPHGRAFGGGRWTRMVSHCSWLSLRHAMPHPPFPMVIMAL